ncbi:uncharacterized protein LOC113109271 [Carassius auratus]|uniref:Uncharacterized protein LOC113109271 n=1 Tax=Carassius auratus TaxID=7957 RepID=A0A6P6Q533_CARAU|nr:uncharacterized protein LOC113109271 [Carassius auratus]
MRKFLFLVLTITASVAFASPPVQDEKLPDPVVKVPVVEKEPNEEHTEAEAGPLVQDEAVADSRLEPDSVLLEPETTEEQRLPEETQAMLEKLVLEADNLTEEIVETELGPELETTDFQKDSNIIPELESETNTEEEDEKEENLVKEEPTLEADYMMDENPEIQMDPGRQSRMTQNGWGTCRGVVLQGKCYQYFRVHLNAYQAA